MLRRPKLAVWKFASCDGCQVTVLDLADELLTLADHVEIAWFLEASSATAEGPYDLSLVEGSITTAGDARRIREIREVSRVLVGIGACATAGGVQALRNVADVPELVASVYARPEYLETLDDSTPISGHVRVDLELRGCPISGAQLREVVTAFLAGREPNLPDESVCLECKRRGTACLVVTRSLACLGPVTHAGCGALCPSLGRPCFGCYGPHAEARLDLLGPGALTGVAGAFRGTSP